MVYWQKQSHFKRAAQLLFHLGPTQIDTLAMGGHKGVFVCNSIPVQVLDEAAPRDFISLHPQKKQKP